MNRGLFLGNRRKEETVYEEAQQRRRPVIGICGARTRMSDSRFGERELSYVNGSYIRAVTTNGGVPLIIPFSHCPQNAVALLDYCDGVIFPGGTDVSPELFGEEPSRDLGPVDPEVDDCLREVMLECLHRAMPMLTICKGMQLLNILMGGTLYQDLSHREAKSISHLQFIDRSFAFHRVEFAKDSRMAQIFGQDHIMTNSLHHQALKELAPGLRKVGWTADGLIEAVEGKESPVLGVQWHPEDMLLNPRNALMNNLFRVFIEEMAGGAR